MCSVGGLGGIWRGDTVESFLALSCDAKAKSRAGGIVRRMNGGRDGSWPRERRSDVVGKQGPRRERGPSKPGGGVGLSGRDRRWVARG